MAIYEFTNIDDSTDAILPRYDFRLIDIGSFTYLEDIKDFDIEKSLHYPKVYTEIFSKKGIKRTEILSKENI
jgi:hypothetical protein